MQNLNQKSRVIMREGLRFLDTEQSIGNGDFKVILPDLTLFTANVVF